MNIPFVTRRAFIAAAAAVSATVPSLAEAENQEPDLGGALEFMRSWDRAWANHDAQAMARLHTADAVTVNRFGTLIEGRESTGKALGFLHSPSGPFGHSTFPPLQKLALRLVTNNVMVLQAKWQNPVMNSDGKTDPVKVNDMIMTFVLVKQQDRWLASEVDPHNVEKMDLPYSNPGQKS